LKVASSNTFESPWFYTDIYNKYPLIVDKG